MVIGGCHLSTRQPGLPRDPEAARERLILLTILPRWPYEEVEDEGQRDDKDDHGGYLGGELHRESVLPG